MSALGPSFRSSIALLRKGLGALALAALLAAFLFTAGCGPSQVRPELVLKVNGQEVARLPQADCGKADWSFPNVPTNVGDAIQVVAVDAQGNPLWTQDFGTLPALPDYLKDIMRQLSPETTEIADFLDAGGYPIEFVPAQELVPDAIAAWDPINKRLELHVDLQNAPLAVLIAALTHEGTHARQPLMLDIHQRGGEERAEAIRRPVGEMLGRLDAGEITVEAFDEWYGEYAAPYQEFINQQFGLLVREVEFPAWEAELNAWQGMGPVSSDPRYPEVVNATIRTQEIYASLDEEGRSKALARAYARWIIANYRIIPTNEP